MLLYLSENQLVKNENAAVDGIFMNLSPDLF